MHECLGTVIRTPCTFSRRYCLLYYFSIHFWNGGHLPYHTSCRQLSMIDEHQYFARSLSQSCQQSCSCTCKCTIAASACMGSAHSWLGVDLSFDQTSQASNNPFCCQMISSFNGSFKIKPRNRISISAQAQEHTQQQTQARTLHCR